MRVTFIGVSSCIPDVGSESPCFLVNGKHLVDTGWNAVLKMREHGIDPLNLESIILTHLHQDHYIGLPHLLFFFGLRRRSSPGKTPLKIFGPAEHLESVVRSALEFLQIKRFPELGVDYRLVPLEPGEGFELDDLRFRTAAASHTSGRNRPEPALMFKTIGKGAGASFAFTGDTHCHPPVGEFAKGALLLVHDVGHTSPKDVATIAKAAGVKRLLLIHYSQNSAARLLSEAREVFPNTDLAKEGLTVDIPDVN